MAREKTPQHEQVIKVMSDNGGFATLGYLYQHVDVSQWGTKTPFRSINRIVQNDKFFFRIKPGLWALKLMQEEVLKKFSIEEPKEKGHDEFNHSYYQGLLVEVGNIGGFETYIPNQDKNRLFLGKRLGEMSSLEKIHPFSYEKFIHRSRTIDVIWFNERQMPDSFFEVEHSTDIYNSLLKFSDLTDFYSRFFIVADEARKREYISKISSTVFKPIRERTVFMSYDDLSEYHTNTFKIMKSPQNLLLRKI